jgi:hypothetical protein
LRQAEAAHRLAPETGGILLTKGTAQYRVGQYAAAVETLTKSEKLQKTKDRPHPAHLAFLAMAQHHLGKKQEAKATLAQLREVMKQEVWAKDADSQSFLREAEETLKQKPASETSKDTKKED